MDGALTKVSVFTPALVEIAYESVLSELAALRDDELLPLNLDPAGVVETLFGVWPRLAALRPELAALSKFDVVVFDKLPHYAGALLVAHGLWKGAARPKSAIGSIAKELWGIRERLYAHAVALSLEGIIQRERLAAVKTQRGHRALAVDILTLVPLFREHWHSIAGRSWISVDDLRVANERAVELLRAIGERETAPVRLSEAARRRRAVYTLLLRAYEAVRAAVQYLRTEEGDAEEIAPSLYARRRSQRKHQRQEETTAAAASASSSVL